MGSFKRFLLPALLALVTAALFGCTGGKMLQTLPSQNDLSGIKGWSSAAVERKFGSEYTETFDSNGNKTWTYKKKSDSNGWMTLGVPVLVDAVTIEFHNDKVTSYFYNPGTLNGGLPGMGALSSALGTMGVSSKTTQDSPAKVAPKAHQAKNIVSDTPDSKEPSKIAGPSSSTSKSVAQKSPSSEKTEAKITIANSRRFNQCSLKDAKRRLCANAQKNGFKVEEKKDGRITLVREGVRVSTSFKQSGKSVLVELSSTGRFTDMALSKDFCRILESCN